MKLKTTLIQSKWCLGFVLTFSVWGLNAQRLLYPTLSSFSFDTFVSNKMVTYTSGETMTGLKFNNKNLIIEGIYVFKEASDIGTILVPTPNISYKVFPNPAKEKFTISNEANSNKIKVDIFLLSGILVESLYVPAFSSVEVSGFVEGIYLIQIIDNNAAYSFSSHVKLIVTN